MPFCLHRTIHSSLHCRFCILSNFSQTHTVCNLNTVNCVLINILNELVKRVTQKISHRAPTSVRSSHPIYGRKFIRTNTQERGERIKEKKLFRKTKSNHCCRKVGIFQ